VGGESGLRGKLIELFRGHGIGRAVRDLGQRAVHRSGCQGAVEADVRGETGVRNAG
jgi:hypothetical protein